MSVNPLLGSCQKGAWVVVKRNEGGIKVETPYAALDSRTDGIVNASIRETLIK